MITLLIYNWAFYRDIITQALVNSLNTDNK